jgi:hypothetical protein
MKIGLIGEGVFDIPVISNIVAGITNNKDIQIRILFPEDRVKPAGWPNVFGFINNPIFINSLIEFEVIIIHLDTDTCQDWKLGLNAFNEDEMSIEEFVNNLQKSLKEHIITIIENSQNSGELFEKIVFALTVNSIECWLLTFHLEKYSKSKTVNCINALNNYTSKKYGFTINKGGGKNTKYDWYKEYDELSRPFLKANNIHSSIKFNHSFQKFVEDFKAKYEATKQQ